MSSSAKPEHVPCIEAHETPQLIERLLDGDSSVLKALYEATWPTALAVTRRWLPKDDAAIDVAGDALQEVFGPLPHGRAPAVVKYDLSRPFLPWFVVLVVRRCIDQLRRNSRRVQAEASEVESLVDEQTASPAEELQVAEQRERLSAARTRLLSPEENALLECWLRDETYTQMAETFSIAEGTVASRIHRILTRLRKEWRP